MTSNARLHSHPKNETHPHEEPKYVAQKLVCHVAGGSLVYILLLTVQLVYKKFFYEKYIQNKLQEFVDLCTVCNVRKNLVARLIFASILN